jgi:TRAP transporter 4TM/12TM fusion protein
MSGEGLWGVPLRVSATFVFLFVLFGAFLERTGAGEYLINLSFALMGRFRGGPAKAAVVASCAMGSISGSSIANTVTTGALTIPLMIKVGFKPHVAGAVEVAASTNGQLMPPIMGAAAFIMAEIIGVPYVEIVKAAFIPAVLSYTAIFSIVHLEAVKENIRGLTKEETPPIIKTLFFRTPLHNPFIPFDLASSGGHVDTHYIGCLVNLSCRSRSSWQQLLPRPYWLPSPEG